MQDLPQLTGLKRWQRERILALDEILREMLVDGGASVRKVAGALALKHAGRILQDEAGQARVLPLSEDGLVTKWYAWNAGGRTLLALKPEHPGRKRGVPDELIIDVRTRCTIPGVVNTSPVINDLKRLWAGGAAIAGLGTWQKWWAAEHPDLPVPDRAPEFPISDKTLYRYAPKNAVRVRGNKGRAAASKHMPTIRFNYSNLRPGELYTFDDVRLDLIGIDDITGYSTEVKAYIAYECGCRYIPSFVLRPASAFLQADVDELTLHTLQVMGLCRTGTTKLMYERGTLTMTPESARVLTKVSDGRIVIIRNGMDAEVAYDGAPAEAGKGHWMGKGVIESLMNAIRLALMTWAGQRGNTYANQPASLGFVGHGLKPRRRTLVDEAEKLAQIELAFDRRLKLDLGLMWVSEIRQLFSAAIKLHNAERGHDYQGHGYVTQVETMPGVWEDALA